MRLTQADVADIVGIADERTIRRVEREEIDPRSGQPYPLTGPLQASLSYLAQGVLDEVMREVIPEFITGDDLSLDRPWNYVLRLWFPRFLAVLVADDEPSAFDDLDGIGLDGERLAVVLWIDQPGDRANDVLHRAAEQIAEYTRRAEAGEI